MFGRKDREDSIVAEMDMMMKTTRRDQFKTTPGELTWDDTWLVFYLSQHSERAIAELALSKTIPTEEVKKAAALRIVVIEGPPAIMD